MTLNIRAGIIILHSEMLHHLFIAVSTILFSQRIINGAVLLRMKLNEANISQCKNVTVLLNAENFLLPHN